MARKMYENMSDEVRGDTENEEGGGLGEVVGVVVEVEERAMHSKILRSKPSRCRVASH